MGTKAGPYSSSKPFHESASQTLNKSNGGYIKRNEFEIGEKVDAHVRLTRGFPSGMKRPTRRGV